MVSKKTEELLKWDREHIIHFAHPVGENAGFIFDNAKGIVLIDTDGKEYIDASSQLINVNLGYGRKEIIDAVTEQIKKLQYATLYWGFANTANIACSQRLAELTPKGLDHFLFTSGGSESIETAIKIARLYWRNKGKNRFKIISLYRAYHGVTYGSMSATGQIRYQEGFEPLSVGFVHIPPYYCYRCPFDLDYPDCDILCAKTLAHTIEAEGADSIAAFIAEPEMGAGGMISPPPEYWPMVSKICEEHDILLIADEIMSGFCRTGKMFAVEHWGVKPDIMTMAKGITSSYLPLGAVAVDDKIYEGLKGVNLGHGFTFGGHVVSCAAATKAMEIYVREKVAEHVARVGNHVTERYNAEFKDLPCVGNLSGLGLMRAIELVADKETKAMFDPALDIPERIRSQARERGLHLRVIGNRINIAPPLIITIEQMDKILDILKPLLANLKIE